MISRFSQLIWLVLALLCGSAFAQEPIRWTSDFNTARRAAAEYKVPIMVHFYGDNCLPCKTLEHRVLSQPEIASSLNRYFICVKVNSTQDDQTKKFAKEFGVENWPTDVFLSPDGKTLFQGISPQDPKTYASILENVKVMNRDRNIMLAAQSPQQPLNTIAQQMSNVGGQTYESQLPRPGENTASASTTPTFYTAAPVSNASQQLPASSGPGAGVLAAMPPAATQGYATPGGATTGSMGIQNTPGQQTTQAIPVSYPGSAMANGLSPGAAGSAIIQHGPLLPGAQPQAIAGSTPAMNQRLAGPVQPMLAGQTGSNLPQHMAPVGQLPPTTYSQNFTQHSSAQASMLPPRNAQTLPGINSVPAGAIATQKQEITFANSSTPQVVQNPFYAASMQAGVPVQEEVPGQAGVPGQAIAGQVPTYPTATPSGQLGLPTETQAKQESTVAATSVAFQPRSTSAAPETAKRTLEQSTQIATKAAESGPALEGYCPVALKNQRTWVSGDPRFAVRHRGKVYWMSNQAAMAEFMKSPDECSPKFSGYDPMLFLKEGNLVDGRIEFGLLDQISGSFMFFSSAELKAEFEQQFDKNTLALQYILKQANVK